MTYAEHFSTRETPQSEQADVRQAQNAAGGFTFQLDIWHRLDRWLILGADGGTYYATERELTIENAKVVQACVAEDPVRAVTTIADVSVAGRAPKNDAAIFALAIAAGDKNRDARTAALAALPKVCRTATHLFQFCEAVRKFRGWGPALRRAVAAWYTEKSPEDLAYQVAKYQQRNGWSHRDLLRLSHPRGKNDPIYRWICGLPLGARELNRGQKQPATDAPRPVSYPSAGELPAYLAAFDELKATRDPARVAALVREHRFTHEMVPSEVKGSVDVWDALSEKMPMTAMVRNLGKMTAVGLLSPMSVATKRVCERLTDAEAIRKARVHPVAILTALLVYKTGHGDKGSLRWSPASDVVDALDAAFYLAFDAVEPTGKRTLLALDVSGSMDGGCVAGVQGLTPRVATAAMAMVTARAERDWHAVAFSSGKPGEWLHGAGHSMHGGFNAGISPCPISPRQRLDDVVRAMEEIPMGGTDCSLPMLYALSQRIPVDVFVVYTDNETWAGQLHPHEALRKYREQMGIPAKLAVVGMTATEFSIADPTDPGMLDVVGFDTAAPAVLADFARG